MPFLFVCLERAPHPPSSQKEKNKWKKVKRKENKWAFYVIVTIECIEDGISVGGNIKNKNQMLVTK